MSSVECVFTADACIMRLKPMKSRQECVLLSLRPMHDGKFLIHRHSAIMMQQ